MTQNLFIGTTPAGLDKSKIRESDSHVFLLNAPPSLDANYFGIRQIAA